MKSDDYEQQHTDAKKQREQFTMPDDGKPLTNSQVILRLIDCYMNMPCGEKEIAKAARMRERWAAMRQQHENCGEWSTDDLEILLAHIDAVAGTVVEAHNTLALFILAKRMIE